MKNISKTDTKLIWEKISHFTPILTCTPNKLKNRKGMVKHFGLLKHCFTHTHTHSHAFQANFSHLLHILPKISMKKVKIA